MRNLERYLDSLLHNVTASCSTELRDFLDLYGDAGEPPGKPVWVLSLSVVLHYLSVPRS